MEPGALAQRRDKRLFVGRLVRALNGRRGIPGGSDLDRRRAEDLALLQALAAVDRLFLRKIGHPRAVEAVFCAICTSRSMVTAPCERTVSGKAG